MDISQSASFTSNGGRVLRLKCKYDGSFRVVVIDETTTIESLKSRLSEDYGFPVSLRYLDQDNDTITLETQNDLDELLGSNTGTVKVIINKIETLPKNFSTERDLLRTSLPIVNTVKQEASNIPQATLIKWKKAEILGTGATGNVYLGFSLPLGKMMAVKEIEITDYDSYQRMSLEREITMLMSFNHPHIIQYYGVQIELPYLNIFLEYAAGGSIKMRLQKYGIIEGDILKSYCKQILLGLEYLHRNGIAHRDIKGANLLLSYDGTLKLSDFGSSKRFKFHKTEKSKLQGTPLWMAPEVIKGECQEQGWLKADIWSVGCTMIEMTTGKPPWQQYSSPIAAMFNIANNTVLPELPHTIPVDVLDFIRLCLEREPSKRPSVTALLLHPYIAKVKIDSYGDNQGSIFPPIVELPRPATASVKKFNDDNNDLSWKKGPVLPFSIPKGEKIKQTNIEKIPSPIDDDSEEFEDDFINISPNSDVKRSNSIIDDTMIINSNNNTMIINQPELVSTPIVTENTKVKRKSIIIKEQNDPKDTIPKPGRTKSPTKLPAKNTPTQQQSTELPPISTSSSKKSITTTSSSHSQRNSLRVGVSTPTSNTNKSNESRPSSLKHPCKSTKHSEMPPPNSFPSINPHSTDQLDLSIDGSTLEKSRESPDECFHPSARRYKPQQPQTMRSVTAVQKVRYTSLYHRSAESANVVNRNIVSANVIKRQRRGTEVSLGDGSDESVIPMTLEEASLTIQSIYRGMRIRQSFNNDLIDSHIMKPIVITVPEEDSHILKLIWGPLHTTTPYCIATTSNNTICIIPVTRTKDLYGMGKIKCDDEIMNILYHNNGMKIISSHLHGYVNIWDVETNKILLNIECPREESIKCMYCDSQTSDINIIICGNNKGNVLIIDPRQKRTITKEYKCHKDSIYGLSCIDTMVLSGSKDNTCSLIDLRKLDSRQILRQHRGSVNIVDKIRSSKKFMSGSKDGTVRIWNLSGQNSKTLKVPHSKTMVSDLVCQNVNGLPYGFYDTSAHAFDTLFIGYSDSIVRQWSVSNTSVKIVNNYKISNVGSSVSSIVTYDNYMVAGCSNGEIKLYDLKDSSNQWNLYGHENRITGLLYHPDLNYIVSSSLDHSIRLWDPPK